MPGDKKPKSNLECALEYAAKGWPVFPIFYVRKDGGCSCGRSSCKRVGKHPIPKNGLSEASTTVGTIERWWKDSPHANIGLATGFNGNIVMDVDEFGIDKKTGKQKVGTKSFNDLQEAYGKLPETLTIKTGSGSRHLYFATTEQILNSQSKVAPDIDVRGHGGYVILPPSNHESGGRYEMMLDAPIADLPDWLAKKMIGTKRAIEIGEMDPETKAAIDAEKGKNVTPAQWAKLLEKIPADCDRDTWWRVGAALKKELGDKRGFEAFDSWSKTAPASYDPVGAQKHWESFDITKGISGGTLFHIAKEYGFRGFDVEAADAPDIRDNWVYVASIKRMVHKERLIEWDKDQFNAMFSFMFVKVPPFACTLKNPSFEKLEGATYWPEQPPIVNEGGESKLNYWKPSGVRRAPGDVKPFLRHVDYLYPNPAEAKILLSYLAFQVQHPGEKVHWAVLLEGDQGNGKSYFGLVMRVVLGERNVRMVKSEQLHEQFTGWQRNTQFIVVEEMMAKQRLELMNKLKPMITESWCSIREMYRPPYEQPNRFNFMFFSNHKDSIIIDSTDRRYCILSTEAPPHPEGNRYYGPLFYWTRNNAPQLLNYFLEYDLGDFAPKAHAPMTAGKAELIKESMWPLDRYIYEKVQNVAWPFEEDLVELEDLIEPLNEVNHRVNSKQILDAFRRLKYQQLKRIRTGVLEEKVSLWAVRNGELYAAMDDNRLRQQWRSIREQTRLASEPKTTEGKKQAGLNLRDIGEMEASVMAEADERERRGKFSNPVMNRKPRAESHVQKRKPM